MDVRPEMKTDTQPFEVEPVAARGRGCGCWVAGITTLLIVVILIGVGLLLPPFSLADRLLGVDYTPLSAEANAVADNGLTLALYGDDYGSDFGVALESVPMSTFLNGDASAGEWVRSALAAAPPTLAIQSPVYTINTSGSAPDEITLSVALPDETVSADLLDLYAWDENSGLWRFIPAQLAGDQLVATVTDVPQHVALFQAAPPEQPRVLVTYDVSQVLSSVVGQIATIVAPSGLQPTLDGKLVGNLAAGFDANAGYLITPAIRNYVDPRATDP